MALIVVRLAVIVACLLLASGAWSQNPPAPATPPSPPPSSGDEGKDYGDYHVNQTIEVGGRISDVTGSPAMYDTLVNQQTGARILEQSLTMRSLTNEDLFDTLTLNSFGWGGDPEQAARLRISKYRWYTFSGSYQHMQNYFNYDLFANPLNPPTGQPYIPILDSPHAYYDRQNLYNFDLVVLPMQPVLDPPGLQPQPHHRPGIQQRSPGYGRTDRPDLEQHAERIPLRL